MSQRISVEAPMLAVLLVGIGVVLVQNALLLPLAAKELSGSDALFAAGRIVLPELLLELTGYVVCRRLFTRRRVVALAVWTAAVVLAAEAVLPASLFGLTIRQFAARHTLDQIEVVRSTVTPATAADRGSSLTLDYTLRFPKDGHYLTFPAYIGNGRRRVFGTYDTSQHAAYYHDDYVFRSGEPYSFKVRFDSLPAALDSATADATIQICNEKSFAMTCRPILVRVRR